jgi:hypothetical protein
MKRLFYALALLLARSLVHAGNSSLTVSSGTFLAIDGFTTSGSQFRQAVVIGDPSVVANVAPVDPVGGLTVRLATSTAVGIGSLTAGTAEIGNVKNSGTFAVQADMVKINGTAISIANPLPVQSTGTTTVNGTVAVSNTGFNVNNTPAVTQSGTWTVQPGNTPNTTAWLVQTSSFGVNGSTMAVVNAAGTKLLVTPDSVALPSNQSVNVNQMGGAAVTLGNNTMANSVPVTMASNQTQMAVMFSTSGANSAGTQIVFISTFANVSASQTNQALVGAIASTKICVHQLSSVAGGTATNLTFTSSGGSSISPLYANAANGGEILPWSPIPWFCSVSGEGLGATTGTGSTTGILVVYGKE